MVARANDAASCLVRRVHVSPIVEHVNDLAIDLNKVSYGWFVLVTGGQKGTSRLFSCGTSHRGGVNHLSIRGNQYGEMCGGAFASSCNVASKWRTGARPH